MKTNHTVRLLVLLVALIAPAMAVPFTFTVDLDEADSTADHLTGGIHISFDESAFSQVNPTGTTWNFTNANVTQTFSVDGSPSVNVSFSLLSEFPGELALYGSISYGNLSSGPIGGGGWDFKPDIAASAESSGSGHDTGLVNGALETFTGSASLPMDWDGHTADWNGAWSATVTRQTPPGVPDSGEWVEVIGALFVATTTWFQSMKRNLLGRRIIVTVQRRPF